MRTQTIERTKKEQTLAIATVRSILKKAGYSIGSWAANGRISGMSNFSCGDLEVKGNEYHWANESHKGVSGLWIHTFTKFVNIEVRTWNDKISIKDIAQVLTGAGLIVSKIESDRLIVDNK